ncbi:MAG: 3-methyl-2-oxobutanoate dehydrogenase subunit VorB [bacterium]
MSKKKVEKVLMRGNHALAEAAIRAGCRFYAGYPITPQNEVPEYMSEYLPKAGGVFIQGESEIASISMVQGAATTGARAMTTSSSPGISLKQEGISFLAGHELPAVIVNMCRGGPGLGNIAGSQCDYFQSTRGGGHGDYRTPVLAPASVQELADLVYQSFDLADRYRSPVLILADGMLGNTMEPIVLPEPVDLKKLPVKEWTMQGAKGRPGRRSISLILDTKVMEEHNWKLQRKYKEIENKETRWEEYMMDDARMAVVAFGTAARIAKGAINRVRKEGMQVGLMRPITLWPFPTEALQELVGRGIGELLVFELNAGQMIEDVKRVVEGKVDCSLYARPGGVIPTPLELSKAITTRYYQKFCI